MTPNKLSASVAVAMFLLVSSVGCASAQVRGPVPPAMGSAEKILLDDPFNRQDPQWRQVRGQWAIQDGSLHQVRDDAREMNAIYFFDPLSVSDAEITTMVRLIPTMPAFQTAGDADLVEARRRIAGAGLVFRYQDENNFYMFRLAGEEGAVLGRMRNGEWSDLANPRAADFDGRLLQMNRDYELRVRVVGGRIQCWINQSAVASLDDTTFTTGRVGLVTFRSQAAFAGIRVVER